MEYYQSHFNLHNRLLNYDNRYMKVTLKSKLIGVDRQLIPAPIANFKPTYGIQDAEEF